MKIMNHIVLSSIVCAVFAGCLSTPTTTDEPVIEPVAEVEQSLGATTQAEERETTYYAEPAKINEVGFCIGPYRCFGPKGVQCFGQKTPWFTVQFNSCGIDP
jgi:hypothetical protein